MQRAMGPAAAVAAAGPETLSRLRRGAAASAPPPASAAIAACAPAPAFALRLRPHRRVGRPTAGWIVGSRTTRSSSIATRAVGDPEGAGERAPAALASPPPSLSPVVAPPNNSTAAEEGSGTGGGEGGGDGGQGGAPWYGVVSLAAMAALICSIDRAAISVAILPMADEYAWSDSVKGAVNSAFYAGYTVTNLIGGYLAASIGSKRVLGTGVLVWSGFTMLTPAAAATRSMPLLLATRCLMGCGEGNAYPCIQDVVKRWVPRDSRSRATTLIYSGGQLGTILALLTAPAIIERLGWPAVFLIYGSLGFVWFAGWQAFVSDVPPLNGGGEQWAQPPATQQQQQPQRVWPAAGASNSSSSSSSSLDEPVSGTVRGSLIQSPKDGASNGSSSNGNGSHQQRGGDVLLPPGASMPSPWQLPWRRFLTNRAFLGIVVAHSTFGMGHYITLSWLPSFYAATFGLDVSASASLSVLPWLATVAVSSGSGVLADWLTNAGHLDITRTRKALQLTGSVLPAACLLALASSAQGGASGEDALSLDTALVLLTGGVALSGFQSAGFASNHQDIAGRYAPLLFGFTNALSSLVGSASVYATGVLLDEGYGWGLVFQLVAAAYLVGAVGFVALGSGERQFE